ncbi:MAG: hypothetical protein M0Z31_10385 [Clostridia bacterium]|nr:hypothetical protein [Clostridia bacterium]
MTQENKAFITFGSQMGDTKAAEVVQPHLIELRRILKTYANVPYSSEIDEFAPIARVDGDIWHWNFEGCRKLRLNRKERYITVDIGMPRNRWEGASAKEIRCYLAENLKQALELFVKRLKKEKISVNEERLFQDYAKVEDEYLRFG